MKQLDICPRVKVFDGADDSRIVFLKSLFGAGYNTGFDYTMAAVSGMTEAHLHQLAHALACDKKGSLVKASLIQFLANDLDLCMLGQSMSDFNPRMVSRGLNIDLIMSFKKRIGTEMIGICAREAADDGLGFTSAKSLYDAVGFYKQLGFTELPLDKPIENRTLVGAPLSKLAQLKTSCHTNTDWSKKLTDIVRA
jgi:hypothetical protein